MNISVNELLRKRLCKWRNFKENKNLNGEQSNDYNYEEGDKSNEQYN